MTYIEYLDEAADTVVDEMRREHGGDEMWKYFEESFNAVLDHIDESILASLAEAWYPEQAEAFPSQAVTNTLRVLARAIWSALSSLSTVDEKRLEKVDWDAIDWRPLLERLVDFDKSDVGGIAREIAKEIGRAAGVAPETVEKQIVGFAEAAVTESLSYIDSLKRLLESAKEIDAEAYKEILKRIEETFLPKIRARITKTSEKISEANAKEFIAAVTETLKAVRDAINTLTKSVEELRKAAAEKPAKPVAVKPTVRPVPVGETAAEQEYLNRLATKWKWGYSPETAEFLAPLTVVWAVATDRLDEYPDLREEAKMWIALNRFVWSSAVGFKRGFLEIEKGDFEWSLRFFDVMRLIENRSPELLEILARFRSRDEVPTGIVYSLAESKLYEFRRTVHGPELGKEVTLRELEEIISRRVAWLEEIEVETGKTSPWSAGKTRVAVPRPQRLLTILRGRCPVCGSEKLELSQVYGPYNPPSANCAIATCLNCHTVYRLYGDGRGVIAPPTLDPEKWRQRWENNPAKDSKHPFTEEWIKNVDVFAKAKGFSVEPQF